MITNAKRKTVAAYGSQIIRPKHHVALHLPDQDTRDCFATERKNKLPKQIASFIHSSDTYERSVVSRALISNVRQLQKEFISGVIGPKEIAADIGLEVGRQLRWGGRVYHAGDLISIEKDSWLLVVGCIEDGLLVKALVCTQKLSSSSVACQDMAGAQVKRLLLQDSIPVQFAHCWEVCGGMYTIVHRSC